MVSNPWKVIFFTNVLHAILISATVVNGLVMNDARGAVLQLIRSTDNNLIAMNRDGTYRGNVVANMQIMVAKAIHDGVLQNSPELQTTVNSIDKTIIDWASSGNGSTYWPRYRCNGDSMHHVHKGIAVIRIEDTIGFKVKNNIISNIINLSLVPFDQCTDYHKQVAIVNAEDEENLQEGPNIRGISVAAVSGYSSKVFSKIRDNKIGEFFSNNANIIVGIDIQGEADSISIVRNKVNLRNGAGRDPNDVYVALRLGKGIAGGTRKIRRNRFVQEILKKNLSRKLYSYPVRGENSEWKVGHTPGGCPFGY